MWQCVLSWRQIGATWRIRLNLCILRPTRVDNPNDKWIGLAVFAQLTAESAYTLQWAPISTRIAPSHGGSRPHLTQFLGPRQPKTQTALRSVQPFLHRWPQSVPILYNGSPVSSSKLPLAMGIWTPWFLGPTCVLNPNDNSIDATVLRESLVWLTGMTERPTQRPYSTRSVTIDRMYICSTATRLNNAQILNTHTVNQA